MKKDRDHIKPFLLPIMAFSMLIAAGGVFLMLPGFAHKTVSWIDALFIAVSAVCVTGLAPFDVFEIYNRAGQAVILCLMQLGGIGIISLTTLAALLISGKISFSGRLAVEQGVYYDARMSLRRFLLRITRMVVLLEALGALLIWLACPGEKSVFNAVFLAVSAFCNAGFAPWGDSLEGFRTAFSLNIIIMILIILGGLGFNVLDEIIYRARHFREKLPRLSFHSRLVLKTSAGLIIGGGLFIFILGCLNPAFADFTLADRLCAAFFEAVTSRTAGFATLNQATFSSAALLLVIFLMFIGGSPGSCAGGLKTTTFRVLVAYLKASIKGSPQAVAGGMAFEKAVVNRALLLLAFSLHIIFLASFLILIIEQGAAPHSQSKPFFDIFFEVVSAFCTVGLSINLTPALSGASKLILCVLMFAGKIGPIWLIAVLRSLRKPDAYKYPEQYLPIG